MEQRPLSRGELLLTYIKLRREGHSMAEAIEAVKPQAFQLSREERYALGNDVNAWEEAQHNEPHKETASAPKQNAAKAQSPIQPLVPGRVMFGTHPLDQAKLTPGVTGPELPTLCPKCGKKNDPRVKRCVQCGTPLKSVEAATRRVTKAELEKDAHVDQQGRVYLSIKGRKQPLEVYVRQEMILGRSSPDSPIRPHIDLTAYDGEKLGVSRAHASLKMQDDTIVISDLESSNQTHINGERLYPHETRVLRHGDEIQLGKLSIKVLFKI